VALRKDRKWITHEQFGCLRSGGGYENNDLYLGDRQPKLSAFHDEANANMPGSQITRTMELAYTVR
jgi:hypothetical protein